MEEIFNTSYNGISVGDLVRLSKTPLGLGLHEGETCRVIDIVKLETELKFRVKSLEQIHLEPKWLRFHEFMKLGASTNLHQRVEAFNKQSEEKELVIKASKKSKPNLIIGVVPNSNPTPVVKRLNNVVSRKLATEILMWVGDLGKDNDNEVIDDLIKELNHNLPSEVYVTFELIDFGYIGLAKKENLKQLLRENLESDEPEYLGYYNSELVVEAFERTRGHGITKQTIGSLYKSENYQEIGLLIQNTPQVLQELVEVLLHKNRHNHSGLISDVIMQGNPVKTFNILGEDYYRQI